MLAIRHIQEETGKKKKKRRCYEHENDRDSMSRRKFKESFTKNTAD